MSGIRAMEGRRGVFSDCDDAVLKDRTLQVRFNVGIRYACNGRLSYAFIIWLNAAEAEPGSEADGRKRPISLPAAEPIGHVRAFDDGQLNQVQVGELVPQAAIIFIRSSEPVCLAHDLCQHADEQSHRVAA